MAESELRYAHELDARYFRDLDRNLRGVVAELESEHGLFRSEPPRSLTAEEEALVIDAWASYLDTALALDRIRRFTKISIASIYLGSSETVMYGAFS